MLRGLWGTCAGGLMDSLSETAGNNRPIQGLSDELLAMALKGQAEKRNRAHFSTVLHSRGVRSANIYLCALQ